LGVLGNGCGIFLLSTIKISKENHGCLTRESNRNNRWRRQLFINQLLSNSSFISSAGSQPLRKQWEKRQLFIKPTYKIKTILNTLTPYWWKVNYSRLTLIIYHLSRQGINERLTANIIITNFKYSTG
jgi:hypothetical protein